MALTTDPKTERRDRLIHDHLHLATVAAESFKPALGAYVPFDDLIAFGREGLVEAASRFDHSKQNSFTTFAWTRIRGAIIDGARSMSWYTRAQYQAHRAAEIASDTTPPVVESSANPPTRRFHPVPVQITNDDDDYVDQSILPQEDAIDLRRLRQRIRAAVAELPSRERHLTERHYFAGENFADIRARQGLKSKFYTSRVHSRALRLLQDALRCDAETLVTGDLP